MNNENRKEHERKRSWPDLCYPEISPEGVRKTTRNLSQDSRSPGRDLNTSPPEYKAGILTTLRHVQSRVCVFYECSQVDIICSMDSIEFWNLVCELRRRI
jgi:hypothetical protein